MERSIYCITHADKIDNMWSAAFCISLFLMVIFAIRAKKTNKKMPIFLMTLSFALGFASTVLITIPYDPFTFSYVRTVYDDSEEKFKEIIDAFPNITVIDTSENEDIPNDSVMFFTFYIDKKDYPYVEKKYYVPRKQNEMIETAKEIIYR